MERGVYEAIISYSKQRAERFVHDFYHVNRVLNYALIIAETENGADLDVVVAAALLHDIARAEEADDPNVCHAERGGVMAAEFLAGIGFDPRKTARAAECIAAHRFKKGPEPATIEAKILFDADKLDQTGAAGLARLMLDGALTGEPLYLLDPAGMPAPGLPSEGRSFLRLYNRKLRGLQSKFYTAKAVEIAENQLATVSAYIKTLRRELNENYANGNRLLKRMIT